jgi:phenylacetate-CoA ligase
MQLTERYQFSDEAELVARTKKLFPLKDHPLYGTASCFEELEYLSPARLAAFVAARDADACDVTNLEICAACFFQTSGTTSRSKQIPYSDADLERQKQHEAIAFRKLGMTRADGVLSLGSPLPSISGWAITNGSRALGATVVNSSHLDYEDAVTDRALAERATFAIGTPIVTLEIGLELAREHGSVRQAFPNMRVGVLFGDVLPDVLRRTIADVWGFSEVLSLYGTVEADVVATECRSAPGELELMQERLIIELLPASELAKERNTPGYRPRAMSINAAPNGAIGELLISDPSREALPILRYRIGDVVQVFRGTGAQNRQQATITVLGRSKNAVVLGGVALYEMQIDAAVSSVLKDQVRDWRLRQVAKPDKFQLSIEAPGYDGPGLETSVRRALYRSKSDLASVALDGRLSVELVSGFDSPSRGGDVKAQRIELMS